MLKKGHWRKITGALSVALLSLSLGSGAAVAADKIKVALALPGAVSDKGFNASAPRRFDAHQRAFWR